MTTLDDHPTLHEMLAPTICGELGLCPVFQGSRMAILPLRSDVGIVELKIACHVHGALDRGLLVLA